MCVQVAVSRTLELVFADESLAIDDVFHISVQVQCYLFLCVNKVNCLLHIFVVVVFLNTMR